MFANVDKSQVPTGFLAEYALPLVPLDVFGVSLTDSSRTTPDGFRFIYGTIYTARIHGANPLPTLQDLNARVESAEAAVGGAIPIMALCVAYAKVSDNAFSANLLSLANGQVYDVPGRSQSPYEVRTLFATAPTRAYAPTGNVSFVFPASLNFQNGVPPLRSAMVDFGDGRGYQAVPDLTQPIAASYSTAGTKRVKVRLSYLYMGSLESWFDLEVGAPAPGVAKGSASALRTTADPYYEFAPIAGVRAGGKAYVHLAAGHTVLTKPLIVAEGYDKSRIAPLIQNKNYSIEDFLLETTTQPGFNFRNALENVGGYDIVFIDYDNGTADILANAGLFEAVLNRVNADKQGTEQNVVMGISMGGLVARYQLADMVKAGRPTQTRLLILQDSPQRGANVPLGIQALTRQALVALGPFTIGDLSQALLQANRLLDEPATQQLLLYQPTDGTGGFRSNTFVEGAYRSKVTFPAGQQPPYQIIAVSQGSQCGVPLFNPSAEILHADGKFFISPLFWIIRTSYYFDITVNALPYSGYPGQVSKLHVYSKVRLFLGAVTIQRDIASKTYTSPSGLLALDGVTGGTEPVADTPGNLSGKKGFSLPFLTLKVNYSAVDKFSFIPTPSALDIADFNPASIYGKYSNGVASTSFSRVDDFLAQESFTRGSGPFFNEAHTTFTARNSEWMFSKMDNRPLAASYCSAECNTSTIVSSLGQGQRICRGTSVTFSIPGLRAGAVVNWSAVPAGNFTVASGSGSTFTTAASSSAVGNSTITATVEGCQVATLTVGTGPGEPKGYYNSGYGDGDLRTYQTLAYPGPDGVDVGMFLTEPYNFTFTADLPSLNFTNTSGTSTHFILKRGQGVTITATATNAPCGLVGRFVFTCPSSPYFYRYAPNPADTELTVEAVEEGAPANASVITDAPPFEAELYDGYGKKVKTKKSERGKAVLDVRDLPAGIYHLRVGKDKKAISEHIQITH